MSRSVFPVFLAIISALAMSACSGARGTVKGSARPVGTPVSIKAPLGLPPVPIPPNNPPTVETIALGRKLFYDVRVSATDTVACATCHQPDKGFSDGHPVSMGFGGQLGTRNAPTVLNAAYLPVQFWDGRAASLEEQAGGPIANPIEMNHPHPACVEKLNGIPEYRQAFEKAFGAGPITIDKIEAAVASFERTVISGNSPFDRYQYGGDKTAMSPEAIRGLALFKDEKRTNCVGCHTMDEKYALFTDGKYHNLGAGMSADGELPDLGRYEQTKNDADRGAFLTPTLRNVALTAPYMHDGSQKTLKEVVDFYVGGGSSNPHLDKKIKELKLTRQERADLVAFLEALTGEPPANVGPPEHD